MNSVKEHCRYYIQLLLRNCARIFFLVPIKKERIVFTAFWGTKVSDNPKCLYDLLAGSNAERFEYVWIYDGDRDSTDLPPDVKVIKRHSFQWMRYMMTAKVIVDDCNPTVLFPPRKRQLYVETWHAGGAYKKVGCANAQTKLETAGCQKSISGVDLFISSSRGFTEGNIKEGYHYEGEVLNCGMPRNDIFFDAEAVRSAAEKVRTHYGIGGPVVLYAPTFRGTLDQVEEMEQVLDVERLRAACSARLGQEASVLVRCHLWDKNQYAFGDTVTDAGDYPDMQELLCAADILITDYSSCMWDYALLGRPCLLYVPDIEQYIDARGFFTPPERWPGILCRDMEELCGEITDLNPAACKQKAKNHLEYMGSYETGHAAERIANRILDYMNGN